MTLAIVLEAPLQRPEHVAMFDSMKAAMGVAADTPVLYVLPTYKSDSQRIEPHDVEQGGERLRAEFATLGVSVVVAFGVTATWALCGTGSHVERFGKWQEIPGASVMPTHHPAMLCRRPELKGESWEHIRDVLRKLGKQCDKCGMLAGAAQKACPLCKEGKA